MRFVPRLMASAVFMLALGGCCTIADPGPVAWDVAYSAVPERVRQSFERGYDPGDVRHVEQYGLAERGDCQEDFMTYRFHLSSGQTITLDDRGRLARWTALELPTTREAPSESANPNEETRNPNQ